MMRPVTLVAILAGMAGALQALPARAQDESDVVVRLSQLEAQMRQMSGKIEELQFQNQQLREQLKRFQEDTEFRFQDRRGRPGGCVTSADAPRERPAPPDRDGSARGVGANRLPP